MDGPQQVMHTDDLELGRPLRGSCGQYLKMPNMSQSSYHDMVVKPKLQHWPWLETLHEFLDPCAEGFAIKQSDRMSHFDIKVIRISISGEVESPIKCDEPTQFKEAISEVEERRGTLLIAKGLSRAMIDILGMEYNLDPDFFASHLQGTESYRTGIWASPIVRRPARTPNFLPDYIRKSPFYTVEFRRPYHIDGGLKITKLLRSSQTSTPRGVLHLKKNLPGIFGSEKISVYKKKGSNLGIILTDQLLSKAPSASYIPHSVSSFDEKLETPATNSQLRQISSRKELIGWLQQLNPEEVKALFNDDEPLALRPVLKIVERTSTMFLAYTRYIMLRIVTGGIDEEFPDNIPFFLQISRALHRHIHEQQKLLRYALRVASLKGSENISEQIEDFGFLNEDMEGALKALEEDVRFLASATSIREGKIVGWVSKFAALFLPVSLLATILSISDPGYTRWVILGGLSVPFVAISIFLMFFWKPPHLDSLKF